MHSDKMFSQNLSSYLKTIEYVKSFMHGRRDIFCDVYPEIAALVRI